MSNIGWGAAPWGAGPWGGGAGSGVLQISTVTVPRENLIRIEFTAPVFLSGLFDSFDASRSELYDVLNFTQSTGNDGQPCRSVAITSVGRPDDDMISTADLSRFVEITLDRAMSPYPAGYAVSVVGVLYTEDKANTLTGVSYGFYGTFRELALPNLDPQHGSRDLSNPQTASAVNGSVNDPGLMMNLGTFLIGNDGDLAFDEGVANLKKRVFRRLMTKENGFAHLPGYGVGLASFGKKLAQSAVISSIITRAESQLKSEPDVSESTVTADLSGINNGLLRIGVKVRMKTGQVVAWNVPLVVT